MHVPACLADLHVLIDLKILSVIHVCTMNPMKPPGFHIFSFAESSAIVIAAACDDGGLRLFEVENGVPGLSLKRVLARVDGRLLAVSWNSAGDVVYAAGTSGIIHVLPIKTGKLSEM